MDVSTHDKRQGRIDRISNQGNLVISTDLASGSKEVTVRIGNRDIDSFEPGEKVTYKLDDEESTSGYVCDDRGFQGGHLGEGQSGEQVDVGATGEDNPPWKRHSGQSAGETGTETETVRHPDKRK